MTEDEEDEPDVEDQEEQTPETEENSQPEEDEEQEEEVEVTHSESSDGLQDSLDNLSASQVLLAGGLAGLLVGLAGGFVLSPSGAATAQPADARDSVSDLLVASGLNASQIEFTGVTRTNGMYAVSVNITQSTANETRTTPTEFYMSPDAELLFRTRGPFGQNMVMNVDQAIQRFESRQRQQQQAPENGTAQ